MNDIRQFGAVGDGATDDTSAIQRTIDACAAAGGGTVAVPAGRFCSGTLRLSNDTNLFLDAGAVLLGSDDAARYPLLEPGVAYAQGSRGSRALITAHRARNVSITGRGTIDCSGHAFQADAFATGRPKGLFLIDCTNVRVSGLSLRNSGFWMLHTLLCRDVLIDGLSMWNHAGQNNDALDIESCDSVMVSNCRFDSGDDAITIKSGNPSPSQNIAITNCVISTHANAIKLGTESVGGFRNIRVSNCVIRPSQQGHVICPGGSVNAACGVALTCVDGGTLAHVHIDGLSMLGTIVPFFIRLGDRRGVLSGGDPEAGSHITNVTLSNIDASAAGTLGCHIAGLPNRHIRDVALSNVRLGFAGGGGTCPAPDTFPEHPGAYPSMEAFGILPAYGLFCRHAEDVRLDHVRFELETPDARPAYSAVSADVALHEVSWP